MKKNGFAPLIIIILIVILVIVLYFAYQTYKSSSQISVNPSSTPSAVSSPSPTINTNLPVIAATSGQKTTIDVRLGIVGSTPMPGIIGTMMVLSGWQVVRSDDSADPMMDNEIHKNVEIKNGEYAIEISTFGTGRAVCGSRSYLKNHYVYFKDQDNTEYFREGLADTTQPNRLDVCSNGITKVDSSEGPDSFGVDETTFGEISYKIPISPDPVILNQMDSMVASFKTNP
jgi:hypothetical protein